LENEYGSFNLEALKFLMHFGEPGSSLYFYFYTYSYFFSFLFSSYIYFFFFISFSLFLFLIFFLSHQFFLFAPLWTLNCIVPTSSPMLRCCSSSGKEAIEIR
jgi:hypothetical protein